MVSRSGDHVLELEQPSSSRFLKIIDANADKSRLANYQTLRCCQDDPRLRSIEINDENEKDSKRPPFVKIFHDKRRLPSNMKFR